MYVRGVEPRVPLEQKANEESEGAAYACGVSVGIVLRLVPEHRLILVGLLVARRSPLQ